MKFNYRKYLSCWLIALCMSWVLAPLPAFAAQVDWSGGKWSVLGPGATDTVTCSGTSQTANADTIDAAATCGLFIKKNNTPLVATGFPISVVYGFKVDSANILKMGTALYKTGDGDTVRVGAGVGSMTTAQCTTYYQGTGYLIINKACTWNVFSGPNVGKACTWGGLTQPIYSSAAAPLRGNGGSLIANTNGIQFYLTGSDTFITGVITLTTGAVGIITFRANATGIRVKVPSLTVGGTGYLSFSCVNQANQIDTFDFLGPTIGPNISFTTGGTSNSYHQINFNRIKTTSATNGFSFGQTNVSSLIPDYNFGNFVDTFTTFKTIQYSASPSHLNYNTSVINVSGDYKIAVVDTVVPGTSTIVMNGTGKQVFTDNNLLNLYYDMQVPNNTGSLICSTKVKVAGDFDADKTVRLYYGIDCAGDLTVDTAGATPDTCQIVGLDSMSGAAATRRFGAGLVMQVSTDTTALSGAAPIVDMDATAATFGPMRQAATTRSTHTGTGAATYAGLTGGDIITRQAGSTNFSAPISVDTLIDSGTVTTAGTGTDSVDNLLWVKGGNLTLGNPLVCGYLDIDDGTFLQKAQAVSCTDFYYGSEDSLAIDGALTVSRHFHFDSTAGTKWYVHGDIDMTGTGNFLWDKGSSTNGLYGTLTQGHAGQTVTWLVPGKSNRYPVFRDGGKLVCASATGDIAGYLTYFNESIANDTILQTNGATLSADSGEIEISANDAGNHYIAGFDAPNIFVNFRPYHEADTCRFYYLGGLNVYRVNCVTQMNYRGEHYFADHTLTIGAGGFGVGSNSSTIHSLFDRTGGVFTSAGNFTVDGETDFNAGDGSYAVAGNLTIGAGANDLSTASWTLNGAGTQAITLYGDTLDSLCIDKPDGTASTASNVNVGALNCPSGTLDITGDSLNVKRNISMAAGFKWLWNTVSLLRTLKDGAIIALNGDSIPRTAHNGTAVYTSSAATGGTMAGVSLNPGDTLRMQAGKKWGFTSLDSAALSGTGNTPTTRKHWVSGTPGTGDTMNFPNGKVSPTGAYFRDQKTASTDTINCVYPACVSGGGN